MVDEEPAESEHGGIDYPTSHRLVTSVLEETYEHHRNDDLYLHQDDDDVGEGLSKLLSG